jgi:hypothetical protein
VLRHSAQEELQLAVEARPVQDQTAGPSPTPPQIEGDQGLPALFGSKPESASKPRRDDQSAALVGIDAKIANASSEDANNWVQIRDQVIKQDEFARDRAHLRTVEKLGIGAKIGLSALAV